MRLTKRSNLAMRILMYCAVNEERTVTKAEIAAGCNSSENHIGQVVNSLARIGYLKTMRGRGGGLRLNLPKEDIRVGTVMRIMEADVAVTECFAANTNACPLLPHCRLRGGIETAVDAFYEQLDRLTVKDLVVDNVGLSKVLSVSMAAE